MKLYKSILAAVALAVSSAVMTGCDEDLAVPPLSIPSTDWKANTTIAELKAKYWSTETNYYTEVGKTDEGENIVIGGRIIANDISGNIYQNLVVQDETGAVVVAVYMKDLNERYKVGEEFYLDVTGLYAGKYAGLFEIGKSDEYNGSPQIGKMDESVFLDHARINGLPQPDAVEILDFTIPELMSIRSNADDVMKYQSQLIRLTDVSFKGGGTETYAQQGTSHNTRYLYDKAGQSIAVDNSGYSDFCDQKLPAGHGTVTAILSYFNGNWQLQLRSLDDVTGFSGESYAPETPVGEGDGKAETPYNVGAVLAGATGTNVWVTGYIVGWIDGMSMAEGAKFTVPATVTSNILMAASPDETSVANCIPVALPNGTSLRTDLNLQNHPDNLGKQVTILGNLERYFGSAGIKSGTAYKWGDKGGEQETPTPQPGDGTGTSDDPFSVDAVISGTATGTGVWMTGYIVGAINDKSISDAAFAGPFQLTTNILVAAKAGETDITKCVPVQLPNGDVRTQLNLVDNASNLGKQVTLKGDPATYFGTKGFKNTSAYAWGDKGNGSDTPVTGGSKFRKVTSVTSGKQYIIVADGKMAKPGTQNYGYLQVEDVTASGDEITADAANAFTFTSVTGGYRIAQPDGRYLYQTGTYNSFNFSANPTEGEVWKIEAQGDKFVITNVSVNKSVQYDSQYKSYGSYPDQRGTYPSLYEKVD